MTAREACRIMTGSLEVPYFFDDGIARSCRHDDWVNLVGLTVEVWHNREVVHKGVVEDVSADSSTIWIAREGASGRKLYDKGSGYQVWIHPRHLQRRKYRLLGDN